jgi:hypothetical protein
VRRWPIMVLQERSGTTGLGDTSHYLKYRLSG